MRKSSIFFNAIIGTGLCLGFVSGLSAQPSVGVTITGKLGPVLTGSGEVTLGNYTSGITATGTSGQTCNFSFTNGGGTGGTASVPLSGTNTITSGVALVILTPGSGYTTPPTAATVVPGGTASCTGSSVVVTTKVDDPLNLITLASSFTATTSLNPVNVTYNPSSITYNGLALSFKAGVLTLPCTATVTVAVNDASVGGNDSLAVSNCNFNVVGIKAGFTAKVALPAGTFPAPLPLAFPTTNIITSPSTFSEGTYVMQSGQFIGDSTTLEVSGTVATTCTGCPSETLTPPGPLTFSAQAGGTPPPTQSVTVGTSPTTAMAYAVTTSTTSGGNWLTVNGSTSTGGQTGGSFAVGVNPAGLAAGSYSGTVKVYTSATNSPQSITVNLTVTSASFTIVPSPSSFTFNSVNNAVPANQNLTVTTSPSSAVPFQVSATSTGGWLSVTPTSGTTGSTAISVRADPTKATPGVNSGTITITASGASNSPLTVNVTFNVTTIPAPSPLTFTAQAGGSNPPNQQFTLTATGPNVGFTATASTNSGGNWLSVSPTSGTTPSTETVSVNVSGLAAATYTGTVNVTPTGGATIPVGVTLTVSSLPSMTPSPASLTFTSNAGATPANQNIGLTSSSGAINYTVAASTTSGGNWLQVSPASASTPGTETVSVNVSGLATGTYSGSVVFTCSTGTCGNSNGQASVPVTLTVAAALAPSPTSVTFNYNSGGSTPASQPIAVTSNGGAITYTAAAATTTGGAWLTVSPGSATTPTGVTASVNGAAITGLAAGTYNGSITLTSSGATNSPVTIPVSLVVTNKPTLSVTGGPLSFNMANLGSLPPAQNLSVTASGGAAIPFTTSVSTTTGGSWLAATPSGTTPGTVSVSILANSLAAGTYSGTVQISSTGASNGPLTVNVTLTVSAAPTLISSSPSLTFAFQTGGTTPANQTLTITSSGAALNLTAAATTTSGGAWLAVSPTSGTTPASLTVSIVSGVLTTLASGTYSGNIAVTSAQAGNSPVNVPVTLTVSSEPSITTAPSSLSFTYTVSGTVPGSQSVTVGSSGTALSSVTAGANQPWLSVTQSGGTTPVTLTVSLVQAGLTGLTAGTYNGSITISAAGAANSPLTYPVVLTVANQPVLTVAPSSLTFSGQVGGANPASQTLSISSTNGSVTFTAAAATTSGGNWLSLSHTSGSTNATVQASVNTSGLAAGTYNGSVTVTASGASGSPAVIPVTLTIAANTITATPNPLSFAFSLGGTAPPAQSISIGSTTPGLSFTATSGASWLAVTPGGGTTPQTLSVSILTAGLTAQTYNSSITITAAGAGNSPLVVPVSLTVSAMPSLTAAPTTLSFNYVSGGTVPSGLSVAVTTSNNSAVAFTVTPSTSSGGAWLRTSPTGATTPSSFVATLAPQGLAAGTYTGTLTISATGYNSASVAVTLVVTQPKAVIQITGSPLFTLANTAPPATTNLTIAVTDGSAQAFTITEGATNYPWLALSATSGTTPATIKLTATPTGLTPGVYVIPLTVTVPSLPVSTQVLYAQLTITGSNLVATPSMLTFTYQPGQVTPPAQSISLTTVTGGTVALASVSTDVGWLKVTPATSAPATLQVSISPGLLGAGMYSGDVIIKGVGSTQASLQIPVTLTVNALPPLTATPATLAFTYQIGGVVPAPQSFALAAGSAALNFTATSPGNWLVLNPTRGMTPGSVLVTVNPLGLAVGTYGGTINVSAIGASNSVPVAVTLTVTPSGPLTIAPSALTFSAPVGGPAPVAQALSVTSSGAALGFTASASSAWLSVSPASGTTPASLSVSVNPTGLASGTYTGAINITATGSAAQVVMVTLQVGGGGATPVIQGVINAASGAIGKVSPGMAISIFGTSLGPQTGVSFVLPQSGGALATTLGGTQVLFDGTPVAVLYASADQVNALVPYELANKANTSLQVEFDGVTSTGTTLTVLPAEPGLFAANGAGTGQGALLNQDSSVNSSTKPAAAGTVIQLFGTGGGVTIPPSVDGTLNPLVSTGALAASTTATVGGQTATVQYSGPAPGLVAGVIQVNVVIPSGTASGNIPVTIQVGGVTSQTVTVAVQ